MRIMQALGAGSLHGRGTWARPRLKKGDSEVESDLPGSNLHSHVSLSHSASLEHPQGSVR